MIDDYVAHIDAKAKLYPLLLWHVGIALCHAPLNIHGAPYRVHYATELGQQPVACVLDNPTAVFSDLGIDQGAQVILEPGVRPFFVQASQTAVGSHIGCEDRRETSLYTLARQASLR